MLHAGQPSTPVVTAVCFPTDLKPPTPQFQCARAPAAFPTQQPPFLSRMAALPRFGIMLVDNGTAKADEEIVVKVCCDFEMTPLRLAADQRLHIGRALWLAPFPSPLGRWAPTSLGPSKNLY